MLIFILSIILLVVLLIKIKRFKYPNVILITGAVKAGKSTLAVHLVKKLYRRKKIKYLFKRYILFKKVEKPLIYSNIPLRMNNVYQITQQHLMREARFNYDSVIYLCESSLVADSMLFKDADINVELTLFNKLIAHELHGGHLIYDTQCVYDNHYAVKRCVDKYIHVESTFKWIPFILISKVCEREITEGDRVTVVEDKDAETMQSRFKWFIFSKRIWKAFDRYCYSTFTDDCPIDNIEVDNSTLKARKIFTFNKNIIKRMEKRNEKF